MITTSSGPRGRAERALHAVGSGSCFWRAFAASTFAVALVAAPTAATAQAAHESDAVHAAPATAGRILGLKEAAALARGDQPALAAFEREAVASEEAAVAAGILPDPTVTVGVKDFPVTGDNAFSPTADNFTMYTIGFMREQVRRSRRQAEAARLTAEAVVSRTEATSQERRIQREVMIA